LVLPKTKGEPVANDSPLPSAEAVSAAAVAAGVANGKGLGPPGGAPKGDAVAVTVAAGFVNWNSGVAAAAVDVVVAVGAAAVVAGLPNWIDGVAAAVAAAVAVARFPNSRAVEVADTGVGVAGVTAFAGPNTNPPGALVAGAAGAKGLGKVVVGKAAIGVAVAVAAGAAL
jgi:hypothetical protein